MPTLGRPPKAEPTTQWCFRLPSSLAARWDMILTDPTSNKINPNVKQELFIPLLSRIWEASLTGATSIDISDVVALIRQRLTPL